MRTLTSTDDPGWACTEGDDCDRPAQFLIDYPGRLDGWGCEACCATHIPADAEEQVQP